MSKRRADRSLRSSPRLRSRHPSANVAPACRRGNSRRRTIRSNKNNTPTSAASIILVIAPIVMAASSECVNVETSQVPMLTPDAVIEPLSKAEEHRAFKLGRTKMKRDRIIQEVHRAGQKREELQKLMEVIETRISSLKGVEARRPHAKQVGVLSCNVNYFDFVYVSAGVRRVAQTFCGLSVAGTAISYSVAFADSRTKRE